MWTSTATRGICAACKFGSSCIYEMNSGHIALQCGQFEMGFRSGTVPADANLAFSPNGKASSDHLGLCANCENRNSCIYQKPEGGVWRCEEYA